MLFGDSSFFNLHLKYSSLLNIKVCQFCPKWRLPTFQDARRLADEQRSRKLGGRTVHGNLSQTGLECSGNPFPVYIESISHRFMNQRKLSIPGTTKYHWVPTKLGLWGHSNNSWHFFGIWHFTFKNNCFKGYSAFNCEYNLKECV